MLKKSRRVGLAAPTSNLYAGLLKHSPTEKATYSLRDDNIKSVRLFFVGISDAEKSPMSNQGGERNERGQTDQTGNAGTTSKIFKNQDRRQKHKNRNCKVLDGCPYKWDQGPGSSKTFSNLIYN